MTNRTFVIGVGMTKRQARGTKTALQHNIGAAVVTVYKQAA